MGTQSQNSDEVRRFVAPAHAITRCLVAEHPREIVLDPALLRDLVDQAQGVGVLPRVASRISRDNLPEAARIDLDTHLAAAAANAALLAHTARELATALAARGIPCVLLKGSALAAHGLHRELGDRQTDDVDVLVGEADLEQALLALRALGYQPAPRMERVVYDGGTRQDLRPPGEHAWGALLSPVGAEIDLHFQVPGGRGGSLSDLLPHCVPFPGVDGPAWMPGRALLLAQLCEHVMIHHYALPRFIPRHVADLADLLQAAPAGIWEEALSLGSTPAIQASRALLQIAHQPWGHRLILPGPGVSRRIDLGLETGRSVQRVLRDLRGDRARLLRKLVPARSFMASSYQISPDDPRIPWLYLHRILTLRWIRHPYRG